MKNCISQVRHVMHPLVSEHRNSARHAITLRPYKSARTIGALKMIGRSRMDFCTKISPADIENLKYVATSKPPFEGVNLTAGASLPMNILRHAG
jgi:hypothetical protein